MKNLDSITEEEFNALSAEEQDDLIALASMPVGLRREMCVPEEDWENKVLPSCVPFTQETLNRLNELLEGVELD